MFRSRDLSLRVTIGLADPNIILSIDVTIFLVLVSQETFLALGLLLLGHRISDLWSRDPHVSVGHGPSSDVSIQAVTSDNVEGAAIVSSLWSVSGGPGVWSPSASALCVV